MNSAVLCKQLSCLHLGCLCLCAILRGGSVSLANSASSPIYHLRTFTFCPVFSLILSNFFADFKTFFKNLFYVYRCLACMFVCVPGTHKGQESMLEPMELELDKLPCECWKMNLLEEHPVLLTTEPPLQPLLTLL